jgi:hypothetical protein
MHRLMMISLITAATVLVSCSGKQTRGPVYYPLTDGSQWVYNEIQVGPDGTTMARHLVVAELKGPTTSSSGREFSESWELTVISNDLPISRQLLVVDGDTVKMLSIHALNSQRHISFDPWFPEWVPLHPEAKPLIHTYATRMMDDNDQPLVKPYITTVEIASAPVDALPVPLSGDRMAVVYNYPATGNRTWYYFAPDSGKVREESPLLDFQAHSFRSSFILEEYIP